MTRRSAAPGVTSLPEGDEGPREKGAVMDRQRALEQEDLSAAIRRLRRGMIIGVFVWTAFFAVDALVNSVFELHSLGAFASMRVFEAALITFSYLWIGRHPPRSFRGVMIWDLVSYCGAAGFISVMCIYFRGFASPYGPGVCLILSHRAMVANDPGRRALLMNAAPALSLPIVLFTGAAFVPSLRAQLHDPRALATFAVTLAFVFGTAILMVTASHVLWSLRQQLFEARSVGRYKLKRRIGAGAMGEVWVAYHAALKRDVSVKILRPDVRDGSPGAVVRFEREVRATTELLHPNTVRVFDYGTTPDGLWYYAMELLEGETLAALVQREGPLPSSRAVRLVFQAARALGEAHARGIVHRDVKPENLFVTELGGERDFMKVLDFGIAKVMNRETDATATNVGWILGTPAYISPEVASGQPASARSDVYGLGAVLYFLLCGHPPFEGANVGAQLFSHIHDRPLPPSEKLGRPVPPELETLVLACLAKDPSERAASGAELATLLAALDSEGLEPPLSRRGSMLRPSRNMHTEATLIQLREPDEATKPQSG